MQVLIDVNALFSFILLLFLSYFIIKHLKSPKNLPPGPYPWPLIGNIPHIGKNPHISLTQLSQIHGPLISLKLGTQILIVASTPTAAAEILKTHDRLLSARYIPKATIPHLTSSSLVWAAECTEKWKSLRALCRTEIFSAKAIKSQSSLREKKVNEMVEYLGTKEGELVKIGEVVFRVVFNTLGNIFFSKDFTEQGARWGLKEMIRRLLELGSTPNVADFFPIFDRFDIQGLRTKSLVVIKEVFDIWEIIIMKRRESKVDLDDGGGGGDGDSDGDDDSKHQDFLDAMLSNGFSDPQINALALDLFTAGTDTTTTTIEWLMAELVKNKVAMDKVHQELAREIDSNDSVEESHLSQLPYLNACVKETLRLHPPVPLLLPHRAPVACEVMNYTIPKDSQIVVNVCAIGRDANNWEDPLSFRPERFIDSNSSLDFRGQDFEFIPFGAGRRMCPGLPHASKSVSLIVAALIHGFDWLLPDQQDASQLDMNEKFGLTLQKEQPLLLIPKKKLL